MTPKSPPRRTLTLTLTDEFSESWTPATLDDSLLLRELLYMLPAELPAPFDTHLDAKIMRLCAAPQCRGRP